MTVRSLLRAAVLALAAAVLALPLTAGGALAQAKPDAHEDPLRAFFGHDDRQRVDSSSYPWSAIGKVYFDSGGHCTGALVAPRVVLTAAHCFFLGDGSSVIDRPTDFFAGFDEGLAGGFAGVGAVIADFLQHPHFLVKVVGGG